MTISIEKSTTKDLGFVLSLLVNGARHGHFEPKIITKKNEYRTNIGVAIAKETDESGYPAHVFVAYKSEVRIGAAIITTTTGTFDKGVEVSMIALKNEHRGKGFGSKILDALLDHYLPRASVYARCRPSAHKLHQMLLRRDFSEIGKSGDSVVLRHGAVGTIC